jgi:hypothetical protein
VLGYFKFGQQESSGKTIGQNYQNFFGDAIEDYLDEC